MHRRALTLVWLATAVLATAVAPAGAAGTAKEERQAEIKQEIQSLREQVAEASAQETEVLGRLDAVQDRRRELDGKVAAIDGQIRAAEAHVAAAEAELERIQSEFVRTQLKLQVAEEEVSAAKHELREKAVAAYVGQPSARAIDVVFKAESMRELAATMGYLEAVVAAQKQALDRFVALRDDTVALRESVAATKDQALAQRNVVLGRKAALETARREQDVVRQAVLAQEGEQASILEEVRSRKAEFQAEIAALRAESNSISGLLKGIQSGQTPQPSGRGVLALPVPGARVTSTFGPRVHPIFHDVRYHDGVDFGAGHGTPIRAGADGVVVHAGPRGGYGTTVIIDHGNALATLYAHQSSLNVSLGSRVSRNQVVGYVGSTGFSTGPHLHFEVRVSGTPVDPLRYL
ncbi:MAG TPA: peptidoglycan DD-metalloendopeptidase family protein [Acidimicrobiales bacterium]|nr:peptidoglycan DD-metalloendopeptidase family protein [Acidimicrobiales bacterium]